MLVEKLSHKAQDNVSQRPTLEDIESDGCIARPRMSALYNMFYKNGPGNGTMLSLPFDQLVEHGPGHAFKGEKTADPREVIKLANLGPFSALALSIGQAEKYSRRIRPDLPLLVKLDGHFLIGKDVLYDRHSTMASIERAKKAGANAVGFTFYLGGQETEQDTERCSELVDSAHQQGLPVFAWMYCRGSLPKAMGEDSLYWCTYGVSAGESIGVDVVKQKFPAPSKNPQAYRENLSNKGYLHSKMPEADQFLELEPANSKRMPQQLAVKRASVLAQIAPNTLKIISGGAKSDNETELLSTLRTVMDSGNEGQIIGRNLWGRPLDQALKLANNMVALMQTKKYHRPLKDPRFTGQY